MPALMSTTPAREDELRALDAAFVAALNAKEERILLAERAGPQAQPENLATRAFLSDRGDAEAPRAKADMLHQHSAQFRTRPDALEAPHVQSAPPED
jgi:hypothetical protein